MGSTPARAVSALGSRRERKEGEVRSVGIGSDSQAAWIFPSRRRRTQAMFQQKLCAYSARPPTCKNLYV
jgi:hypothetical protein